MVCVDVVFGAVRYYTSGMRGCQISILSGHLPSEGRHPLNVGGGGLLLAPAEEPTIP